jgi:hypothetical protein
VRVEKRLIVEDILKIYININIHPNEEPKKEIHKKVGKP